MKVQEKHLWAWLKKADKDDIHISRIENALSRSTPDVEASIGFGGFWLELKTAAYKKAIGEGCPDRVASSVS